MVGTGYDEQFIKMAHEGTWGFGITGPGGNQTSTSSWGPLDGAKKLVAELVLY